MDAPQVSLAASPSMAIYYRKDVLARLSNRRHLFDLAPRISELAASRIKPLHGDSDQGTFVSCGYCEIRGRAQAIDSKKLSSGYERERHGGNRSFNLVL
jgi:hypothetical protein